MKKLKANIWAQLIIIYTRFAVGGGFVFASIIKIKGKRFTTDSGADFPIDSAWHLFETLYQSGLYWQFLGLGQLVAGFLLMTQKYSKLGALLFLPIIANIFVITISYDFNYTPVITGLMFITIIALVLWDWNTLRVIIGLDPELSQPPTIEENNIWIYTGFLIFLFTAIYRLLYDRYDPIFWFIVCAIIGLIGLLLWLKNRGWNFKTV